MDFKYTVDSWNISESKVYWIHLSTTVRSKATTKRKSFVSHSNTVSIYGFNVVCFARGEESHHLEEQKGKIFKLRRNDEHWTRVIWNEHKNMLNETDEMCFLWDSNDVIILGQNLSSSLSNSTFDNLSNSLHAIQKKFSSWTNRINLWSHFRKFYILEPF